MKLEHFALNVPQPLEMANWYATHLGMSIIVQKNNPPYITFLGDSSGNTLIELYHNTKADIPSYQKMNPLVMHLAFVSLDPDLDKDKLVKEGATFINETKLEDGSHLVMLKDPWGISIQLCKRANSMLMNY